MKRIMYELAMAAALSCSHVAATEPDTQLQYHRVPFGAAASCAKLLGEIYDCTVRIEAVPPDKIAVWGRAKTHIEIDKMIGLGPEQDVEAVVIQVKTIRATTMALLLKSTFNVPKDTGPFVEADSERNAIRVRGTKEQVSAVREEIVRIETRLAANAKGDKNAPEVRFHDVPQGKAEMVVKTLQAIFPNAKIQAIGPTRLFAYADPQTHSDISAVIGVLALPLSRPVLVTEVIRVKSLDSQSVADLLNMVFVGIDRSGASIIANKERNAVVVRGTPDLIKEVRLVLEVYRELIIDVGPNKEGAPVPNVRIVPVEDGHAQAIAEGVQSIFPKMYTNKPPKVTFAAIADSVVVISDDAKALDQGVELIRLILQAEAPQCDYEVISLKHAKPAGVAKIVDEIYNRKKNDKGERIERVRVVVDAQANAVLLRGRALDRAAIRDFVTRHLDVPAEKK